MKKTALSLFMTSIVLLMVSCKKNNIESTKNSTDSITSLKNEDSAMAESDLAGITEAESKESANNYNNEIEYLGFLRNVWYVVDCKTNQPDKDAQGFFLEYNDQDNTYNIIMGGAMYLVSSAKRISKNEYEFYFKYIEGSISATANEDKMLSKYDYSVPIAKIKFQEFNKAVFEYYGVKLKGEKTRIYIHSESDPFYWGTNPNDTDQLNIRCITGDFDDL